MKKFLIVLLMLFIVCLVSCQNNGKDEVEYFIIFDDEEINLNVGKDVDISYTTNYSGDLIWQSDDEDVAIAEEGFVTAIGEGSCNIILSSSDGKVNGSFVVNVKKTGRAQYDITIGEDTLKIASGIFLRDVLEIEFNGRTYELKDGLIFDGWYSDPEFKNAVDIDTKVEQSMTLYPKYRESQDKIGYVMQIDNVIQYRTKISKLGEVIAISPSYEGKIKDIDLSNYYLLSVKYDLVLNSYVVDKSVGNDCVAPYNGFIIGLLNTSSKIEEYKTELAIGSKLELNGYSINASSKIYFDRVLDKASISNLSSANVKCAYASIYDETYDMQLFDKAGDKKAYPASTTKIITAMAALKYCPLDTTYTIGDELNCMNEGSSPSLAGLKKGQVWTLRQLLYATLLPSGNDAAYSVAALTINYLEPNNTYTARETIDKFAELMNEVAEECGATNSHFMVPDGNSYYKAGGNAYTPTLWDDRLTYHYTTANDMVKIARYAFKFGALCEVVKTRSTSFTIVSGESESFTNTNSFLNTSSSYYKEFPYVVGMKTGTTTPAGACLISGAEVDGRFVIVAVLNSSDRYADSLELYKVVFN